MTFFSDRLIYQLENNLKKNPASKSFAVLAQIYYEQDRYKKAKELCLEGLKYHPSHSSALLLLGQIYMDEKNNKKALKYLNRARIVVPSNPKVYEKLIQLYTRQNQLELTIETYKIFLILQPDNQMAIDMLSYLQGFIPSKRVSFNLLHSIFEKENISESLKENRDSLKKESSQEDLKELKGLEDKEVRSEDLEDFTESESLKKESSQESLEDIEVLKDSSLKQENLLLEKKTQTDETSLSLKLSEKRRVQKKIVKLNQMLAGIENYIQKKGI
ncbi:MAG: tetratricopeptide repeat protein [Bdellovibrionales bacterium]|nr:tetratricopeptide repeat protein [Bdellovibrionales bacterium]